MLKQIERDFGVSLRGVPVIGDSDRDLAAARAVGARPILVLSGYGQATRQSEPEVECFSNLAAAVAHLIADGDP